MERHLFDKYKEVMSNNILLDVDSIKYSINIGNIDVIATENDIWQPFNKGDKNFNFILGFQVEPRNSYIIRVYSTELSGKEMENIHERYFDIEVDLEQCNEQYISSVIDGLKCVTWSIEKSGAIKYYYEKEQVSKPLRDCVFEYDSKHLLYDDEFDIKVSLATDEEKQLLNKIRKEQR